MTTPEPVRHTAAGPMSKAVSFDPDEIGSSGLRKSGGQVIEEFLVQLRGAKGRRTFREMSDNDAVVAGVLFGFEKVVARLDWHVEPPEGADKAGQDAAEFVQECLDDMSASWGNTLDDIMSMCAFGWSFMEIVYKKRNGEQFGSGPNTPASSRFTDGKIGWRHWASRSQETLLRWDWDDAGGLQAMTQMDPYGGGLHTIPIDKALLFRTSSRLNNPEGRSLIRGAYRSWYFKKRIEEFEAIGVERDLAGLPVGWVPSKWLSSEATDVEKSLATAVQTLVQTVKRNESEGIVMPLQYDDNGNKMIDFQLVSSGGTRQFNTDGIIARYNQQIAMSVLADFLLLGHEQTGSYALGASKIDLWTMAVEAIARSISNVVNQYAIPRLLRLNGMTVDEPPTLEFGKVSHVDLALLGTFLQAAATAGVLVPDGDLEAFVREVADLPAPNAEALMSDEDGAHDEPLAGGAPIPMPDGTFLHPVTGETLIPKPAEPAPVAPVPVAGTPPAGAAPATEEEPPRAKP